MMFSSKTGEIVVQTDANGLSSITLYFGANSEIRPEDFEELNKGIKEYDYVYAATNLPLDSLYRLVEICNQNGVGILVDFPNQQKLVQLKRLANVDYIIPNRQEAELLLNTTINTIEDAYNAVMEIRKECLGNIVITLDKDGCVLLEKGSTSPVHYQTQEVEVVDATASGDIMRATLLSQYLKDGDLNSAVKKAVSFATESVKLKGVDHTIKSMD